MYQIDSVCIQKFLIQSIENLMSLICPYSVIHPSTNLIPFDLKRIIGLGIYKMSTTEINHIFHNIDSVNWHFFPYQIINVFDSFN